MPDLMTELRDHADHIDATMPPVEDLAPSPLAAPVPRRGLRVRRPVRAWAVVLASAALVLLLVGGLGWLLRGTEGDPAPPADKPADRPSPPVVVSDPTPEPPEPAVSIPDTVREDLPEAPVPEPTVGGSTGPSFDYPWVGAEVGQSNTPFGSVEWWHLTRVPADWVMEGFPQAGSSHSMDLVRVYDDPARPCCFEVYEVPGGYLGFGAGEATRQTAWNTSSSPQIREWYAHLYSWVFVTEVWFSADGDKWELMTQDPFDSGAAVMHDPSAVAVHEGRWIVVGWVDVPDDDRYSDDAEVEAFVHREPVPASSIPAAWVSEDLRTWTRLGVDFTAEGTHTMLSSVAGSDQGWVIGGVRKTVDSPIRAEWVMWGSRDGQSWEQLEIADVLGTPECKPTPKRFCNRLKVEMIDDAIVAYGWQWELPVFNLARGSWTLWVGVPPIG